LDFDRPTLTTILQHIARYAPIGELDSLGTFVKSKFSDDLDFQLALFNSVASGAEQRGATLREGLRNWGSDLCSSALAPTPDSSWFNVPLENAPTANPWAFQERKCSDGQKVKLLSSLPHGEQLTGVLRSHEFILPQKLSLYLAGHDGFPDKPAQKKNVVRLRAATSGAVLAEAFAPRNDVAQKITWDLASHPGQHGFLEVTDADTGSAYAWIAFGRFDPPMLALPMVAPAEIV